MWTFHQSTGELLDPNGKLAATGYSGYGRGKNNPALESVAQVGPIPAGEWRIVGGPYDTTGHGPFVLRLRPMGDTHGRSGFLIHGDSSSAPGTASKGCIILDRKTRELIWNSGDRKVLVVH
jgi:hypothetical protein